MRQASVAAAQLKRPWICSGRLAQAPGSLAVMALKRHPQARASCQFPGQVSAPLSRRLHRAYSSSDFQPDFQGDGFNPPPTVLDGPELGAAAPAPPGPHILSPPLLLAIATVHPPVTSQRRCQPLPVRVETMADPQTAQATSETQHLVLGPRV